LFKITRIRRGNRASGSQNLKSEVSVIPRSFKKNDELICCSVVWSLISQCM